MRVDVVCGVCDVPRVRPRTTPPQLSVAIFLSLLFLEAYTITLPYMEMDENILAIAAQLVIFIICFCGLVGKLDEDKFQGTDGAFVGFFLTTVTSLVLGLAVAISTYQVRGDTLTH